ncbi:terminase large subunit [Burkholderia phage Bm1]
MATVVAPGLPAHLIKKIEENPYYAMHPEVPGHYVVYASGRGTGKSHNISDTLVVMNHRFPGLRALVAREKAASNSESTKEEMKRHIKRRKLSALIREVMGSLVHRNGSKTIFRGLNEAAGSHKAAKSTAKIHIAWVEEGQEIGRAAWDLFLPTVRENGSKVVISCNPEDEDSYLAERWLDNPGKDTIVIRLYREDNPHFPQSLVDEMAHDQLMIETAPNVDARRAAQAYFDWKWLGAYKKITDKQVIKRAEVLDFETPEGVHFYHGMDHGFASDPACVVRCFILKNDKGLKDLYIDYASFGYGVGVDDLPGYVAACPTINRYGTGPVWDVYADCARPELNSKLKNASLPVEPCEKWDGSVEDGIGFLNSFNRIYIKPELTELISEAKNYSYKVDRITGKPLPVLVDKDNHGWDAVRYALQDLIKEAAAGYFDMEMGDEAEAQAHVINMDMASAKADFW